MTPYVRLQQQLIDLLFGLKRENLETLKDLVECCRTTIVDDTNLVTYLNKLGLSIASEEWHAGIKIHELILEQIDDSGDEIVIRNLLGKPLSEHYAQPYDLEFWINDRGNGNNGLRNDCYSQPRVLEVGDVLITGERVISPPREGGNGAVLVHLSGHEKGTWLSFPGRTALALIGCHKGPIPSGLIEDEQ
jgi:hypothetical protein